MYSWGLNFVGQLGLGKISGPEVEAKLVGSLLPGSSTSHSKRSKSREGVASSSDSYGGARTSRRIKSPLKNPMQSRTSEDGDAIPLLNMRERVYEISCGTIHSLIRTDQGRVFSCGNGGSYAHDNGNTENCYDFKEITSLTA